MALQEAAFQAHWVDIDELTPTPVNQAAGQVSVPVGADKKPDAIHLILGHVSPPMLIGDEAAVQEAMDRYKNRLAVTGAGRFVMSKAFAEELIRVLAESVSNFDESTAIAEAREEAANVDHV